MQTSRARLVLALLSGSILFAARDSLAAPGDILRQFTVPVSSGGGRGVAFDGTNLYYTMTGSIVLYSKIYKISPTGVLLATIPTTDYSCGGPLAWDGQYLWTTGYAGCADGTLYQVDPADGSIVSQADASSARAANQPDGLDFRNATLVLSAEALAPTWVSFLGTSGALNSEFHAVDRHYMGTGGLLIGPSGVSFDGPCYLWHTYPLSTEGLIVQTDLTGLETGLVVHGAPQVEDLALDEVTFAPKTVLWGLNQATMFAIEVPAVDPCLPTPTRSRTWGSIKLLWR